MGKALFQNYGTTGRVGNQVYFRDANGNTVVREAVTPKNPKTNAQTLQRVIMKQVGKMYAAMKTICDHSFEGVTYGAKSAAKFRKLNANYLRERAAEIVNAGGSLAQFFNFTPINSDKFAPGAAIIAQGQLPKVVPSIEAGSGKMCVELDENTYAGVCAKYGLKRGDQLTFITFEDDYDDGEFRMHVARVILDPRNQDGSGAAMSSAFVSEGNINLPNRRNEGTLYNLAYGSGAISFYLAGAPVAAAGVIVSRKTTSGEWLRSNAQLIISEENLGTAKCSLYDACADSYNGASIDVDNEMYLNNAGEGGSQGSTPSVAPSTPTDPTYSNTASINGISQNVSGGSVNATAPLNSVVITGTNLAEAGIYATKNNGADHIIPTKTATTATFSALNGAASDTFRFFKTDGGSLWFAITVSAAGGGNDDPDMG